MRTKGVHYRILSPGSSPRLNCLWCGAEDSPIGLRQKNRNEPPFSPFWQIMRSFLSRPISPALLSVVVAVVGGVIAGGTAVHGLHLNSYGPVDPPSLFSRAEAATPTSPYEDGAQEVAMRCDQCGERDLGYRWAALAAIRLPDQCPNDSWAFRRGCLDYVGGI